MARMARRSLDTARSVLHSDLVGNYPLEPLRPHLLCRHTLYRHTCAGSVGGFVPEHACNLHRKRLARHRA